MSHADLPQRIFSTGSLAHLPRFDPVAQLCASSNIAGWTTTTSQVPKQLKRKAQSRTEEAMQLLLSCMNDTRWSVKKLRAHANSTNGTSLKEDTVRDYLHVMVARKMVVKSLHGHPHLFWKV